MIFGKVSPTKFVIDTIKVLGDEFEKGGARAVQLGTLLIHGEAKKLIQDVSDGVPTIRYNTKNGDTGKSSKRIAMVSKPGDPPNSDTGRLVQSILFDFNDDKTVGRVGTNVKYGAWLEFGTRDMAARPWLSKAIENKNKEIIEIFAKEFQKAYKRSVK